MKVSNFKSILMIMILGLLFQSCSKEEGDIVSTEEFRRGDRGGNGGPDRNDSNVDNLDNGIINEWTEVFLQLDRYSRGMRPNASARALAYIHLAAYETAAPGMRNHTSVKSNFPELTIDEQQLSRNVDYQLALNACYAVVLDHFILNVPSQQKSTIAATEQQQEQALSRNLRANEIAASKEWGQYVAQQVIAYSKTDTEAETQILSPQPASYEPPVGDGFWTYSAPQERALFPYWESVRTFVIAPEQTTTVVPKVYSNQAGTPYFEEMEEVYNVNNAARAEQNDQLWIAEFWSDDVEGLMMSPPGRQIAIADQLIDKYKLSLESSLALLVKVGFALNDAAVSTWKYKYQYMVMRPSEFIHEYIDPTYQTNLYKFIYWPNPSFPGYPSGHSCFASAAGGIFIDHFGDNTNFTDRSHAGRTDFLGTPRSFTKFSTMVDENAFSRIPLGVHIRMDCVEGVRLGYEISDAVNELDLSKKPG